MKRQKSFQNESEAALYLVPTPIGNLEDMTFRAVNILKSVDCIAAEDTRNTKKLCNHFDISVPMISYHEHNKTAAGQEIITRLTAGQKVAIVSDAGMPAISDPGYEIVSVAIENEFKVISLPGANAALTALVASGIVPQPFYFHGFLSRGKSKRVDELRTLQDITAALLFYEAPHRIRETMIAIEKVFGNRQVVLARELSKKFEEYIRGTASEINETMMTEEVRGEFVIVVEGNQPSEKETEEQWWSKMTITEHTNYYIEMHDSKNSDAIKMVSKDRGVKKQDVYKEYHM